LVVESHRGVDAGDWAFVEQRRVGHLATADGEGRPSVVPVVYATLVVDGEPAIAIAIDEKPKGEAARLRRVRNIRERPEVALIVDDYTEDWQRLAWVLVRGAAAVIEPGETGHGDAVAALRAKYPQYVAMRLEVLPVILVRGLSTRSWRGGDGSRVDAATSASRTALTPDPSPIAMGEGGIAAGWVASHEQPDSVSVARSPERFGRQEFASLIRGRRSVRAFDTRPVPRGIVEEAIAAAGWAPSPHGRQPWRFVVVESQVRRDALADAMAATWRTQLRLDGQDQATVAARLEKSRDRLHRAPVLIVPCLYLEGLDVYPDADRQRAEETMAVQSLGAAVQNLLLSLYSAGVDGGWMCAPLFCPEVVQEALGLSSALNPHALIAVGYAAADPVRRPRLPLDDLIVDWQ
jgi:coenzyme F420-0:L-glutamate ligase/coenzyme F420-1:gamma-L-glutamate ligase